jgi:hypothetical protein
METKTVKRSDERMDSFEQIHFKFLFLIVFLWFLMASLGKFLITPQSSTTQNFWKEAVTQTNSLVPYLFMRV